jgi:protein-S-isoprenylcysteine O-methyltransferase Ste14
MADDSKPGGGLTPILFYVTIAGLAAAGVALWKVRAPVPGEWIWIASFAAQAVIRMPHHIRNAGIKIEKRHAGLGERIMLFLMFATMMVLPLVHIGTPLLTAYDYALPDWSVYAGGALSVMFVYYFWRSHADLGTQWSATLEVREQHRLVTRGVYARMRHPMYLAIWLAALAQPLLIQNWIAGPSIIAAFALMYFVRVPYEEAMMRETFGQEWDDYAAKTPRIAL